MEFVCELAHPIECSGLIGFSKYGSAAIFGSEISKASLGRRLGRWLCDLISPSFHAPVDALLTVSIATVEL